MFRVTGTFCAAIMTLIAVLAVSGCSMNSPTLSSGFASNSTYSDDGLTRLGPSAGTSGRSTRTAPGTRVASLNDQAPAGTYETAPKGALSDRDYSGTRLDVDKARDLINQYRADKGLKPLKLNTELTAAAKAHARDLAKWDRISHYGSDGSNPWDRVKRTGYKASLAAENVGTGQVSFEEVLRGWKQSEGHNKNLLLGDARHMGLALVQAPNTEFKSFWTLVLGSES
ncbi:MAG: CAP domain-containing protein [Pseudomonadota bacterium]